MSRTCAKPTCSAAAARWFDFMPTEQQVIERRQATELSVALCEQHGGRFSVPSGWTLTARPADAAPEPQPNEQADSRQPIEAPIVHRSHQRGAPWFLALSDDRAPSETAEVAPVLDREPSAGSLLHRAFHGPDRQTDIERARQEATSAPAIDELSPRRVKRSTNGYDSAQLPFPPLDEPESHVAVS